MKTLTIVDIVLPVTKNEMNETILRLLQNNE